MKPQEILLQFQQIHCSIIKQLFQFEINSINEVGQTYLYSPKCYQDNDH